MDRYYTNDDDVIVIKMVRVKLIMLTAVMKSGSRGHGDDGPD